MLLAAARRFALVLAGISAAIVVVSLAVGLLAGSAVTRSVSLGFYLGGAVLVLGGFFFGNRGPVRPVGEGGPVRLGRGLRTASPDEMVEAINMSAVLVTIGFVLLAIGAGIDPRYDLF